MRLIFFILIGFFFKKIESNIGKLLCYDQNLFPIREGEWDLYRRCMFSPEIYKSSVKPFDFD